MLRRSCVLLIGVTVLVLAGRGRAAHGGDSLVEQTPKLHWHQDYREAYEAARQSNKMLLIFFVANAPTAERREVEARIAKDESLQTTLGQYVLARLPLNVRIRVGGEHVKVIEHDAMREMHGHEGLAIIDLMSQGEPYYGRVVSSFPFVRGKYYRFRADYLPEVLDLPQGTLTQRTMVWAVRIHPERPASTQGQQDSTLTSEACSHSHHQARIGVQGHHNWGWRFGRIIRRLRGRRSNPVEVVAESWPQQTMIDSCIDCVASWRQSSGHWNAVKSLHASYGYDIQRGRNGIWYGTGIFAN